MSLETDYALRFKYVLQPLAAALEEHLSAYMRDQKRVDRVCARAKSVERFVAKAKKIERDHEKYIDPINQIQDQIGARIVVFYKSDVDTICNVIEKYFRAVESKWLAPESQSSFGYFGRHYVLLIPQDILDPAWSKDQTPSFFELQVKTLFQHAWAEANHDVGYKPELREISADESRKLAFTAAQAWGADEIFNELFKAGS